MNKLLICEIQVARPKSREVSHSNEHVVLRRSEKAKSSKLVIWATWHHVVNPNSHDMQDAAASCVSSVIALKEQDKLVHWRSMFELRIDTLND
jgi:hypothetical protein